MQNFVLQFKTTPQFSHLTRGIRLQTPNTVHCRLTRNLEGKISIYDLMSLLAVKKSQFQSNMVAQTLLIKLTISHTCCFKISFTYGKHGITNNNISTYLGLIIKVIVHPGN